MAVRRRDRKSKSRSNKISPFEKMDQIRYQCYEINIKMKSLKDAMQSYPVMPNENNMIEIPAGLWKEIAQISGEVQTEFQDV